VVTKLVLRGCLGILGGCKGVDIQLPWYSGWLLGCCFAVARVFEVVAC